MIALIHTVIHAGEHNVTNKALDTKSAENTLHEAFTTIKTGFPLYGLPVIVVVGIVTGVIMLMVLYSVAGKGSGSHAGREEPRRAYRRELARQMARDDAKKILAGEDPTATKKRRKWMQW